MPLTANTPKPLLEVRGVPLIDGVLDSLPDEIDEVIIVVKYLGDQIKKHVGKKYRNILGREIKIKYVTGSDRGNLFSFLAVEKHLKDERFLLIYGDEIPTWSNIWKCMRKDLSVLTFRSGWRWINDGVMVLHTDIFDEELIFGTLVEQFSRSHKVHRVKGKSFLGGINTPEDIERANKE